MTSRKDLLLRAARDEHFLQNVARPILGPLLTDESRLVILDPDTLAALRDTLQARRQGEASGRTARGSSRRVRQME